MTTPPTRNERQARRNQVAAQWSEYLKQVLTERGMTARDLERRSDGVLESGKISHWIQGDNTASIQSALAVARALNLMPSEVLRASGHHAEAKQLEGIASGQPNPQPATPDADEAMNALIAAVTEGLTSEDAPKLKNQLREDIQLVIQLSRRKADMMRELSDPDIAEPDRNAGAS